MTAHRLGRLLLSGPDKPVFINGWGSDEGLGPFEVSHIDVEQGELFLDYTRDEILPEESATKNE